MTLTFEMIHSVKSGSGGWNKTQLALLGVDWPPPKGWIEKLIGKEIDQTTFDRLSSLRGKTMKQRKREQAQEDYLFLLEQTLPICSKCKVNKVFNGSKTMDWCQSCIWEFVKEDQK